MKAGPLQLRMLAAAALALACEGREVAVFELPAHVNTAGSTTLGGNGGSAGSAGSAGAGSSSGDSFGAGGSSAGLPQTGGTRGDGGAGSPARCGSDADCEESWVCEKPGCDAPTGNCVQWPPFCPPILAPVCGCNGVTYWNDCIRLKSRGHPQLQSFDLCRANAAKCETGADCTVPYASCSHLLPPGALCAHSLGACWVLPPQCDPNPNFRVWRECKAPGGEPPACLDMCNAIATEHSYAELHRDEVCN